MAKTQCRSRPEICWLWKSPEKLADNGTARETLNGCPRLHEPAEPLRDQFGTRKNGAQFAFRHEPNFLDKGSGPHGVRARPPPAAPPSLKHRHSQRQGHPLPPGHVEVRLHGKPEVRRLNPERLADSLDLQGHTALVLESEQMLNNGVTEGDVEATVAELAQICCVTGDWFDIFVPLLFGGQIKAENLYAFAAGPPTMFPKCGLAPTSRMRSGRGSDAAKASNRLNRRLRNLFANELGSSLSASCRIRGMENSTEVRSLVYLL